MPVRIASNRPRGHHFIKEWREYRNLTQQQLADKMGTSKASISRVENYEQPYTQDFLELCATVLNTAPIVLIGSAPNDKEAILPIWERARPGQRKKILKAAKDVMSDQD